jgi:hypothetical protein
MGIFFFDDRTQVALLVAGLLGGGAGLGGCEATQVVDMVPTDMHAEPRKDARVDARKDGRADARKDGPLDVDPLPPDAHAEGRRDGPQRDHWIVDPLPPDGRVDARKDSWIVDPLPVDASAGGSTPAPKPQPRSGEALPLERELRASIRSQRRGAQLELVAHVAGEARSELTYRWKASGGALDHGDRSSVRWTPPTGKGRHMVQLTVRDGKRTISVDVLIYEVK